MTDATTRRGDDAGGERPGRSITEGSMCDNTSDTHYHYGPPGDRYTGNLNILKIEAQQAADGDPGNAAMPVDEQTEQQIREWCDREGLTPAWEVSDV